MTACLGRNHVGGGNPGPEIVGNNQTLLADMLANGKAMMRFISTTVLREKASFLTNLAQMLREELGWRLNHNVNVTNGGPEVLFSTCFNLFAGRRADGTT